jgi:hypothetical protein
LPNVAELQRNGPAGSDWSRNLPAPYTALAALGSMQGCPSSAQGADQKVIPASVNVAPASEGKASSSSSGGDLSSAGGTPPPSIKVCCSSAGMFSAAQDALQTASKLVTRIVFVKVFICSPTAKDYALRELRSSWGSQQAIRWLRISARPSHRKPSARARSCQRHRPCELQTSVSVLTIDCEHTDKVGMAVSMARKNASARCCPTLESGRCSANM